MVPTFAIIVAFDLHPGYREQFLAMVRDNAGVSVGAEPGCLRFDVLTPELPDRILLYEIYTDRAAFDAHLASPHFKYFDAATRALVTGKTVTVCGLVEHIKGDA